MILPDNKTAHMYLLYFDEDSGDRECWNTFYTPVEVFSGQDAYTRAVARGNHIENITSHMLECVLQAVEPVQINPSVASDIDHPIIDDDAVEDDEEGE